MSDPEKRTETEGMSAPELQDSDKGILPEDVTSFDIYSVNRISRYTKVRKTNKMYLYLINYNYIIL